MPTPASLEQERLLLERDKLRFERQKFADELRLRRRASPASSSTLMKEFFANPLALVIVGGFLTLMTGIATTAYTAAENRKAEALRASYTRESARDSLQADLIKKFVEGPSPSAVRSNLKFLIDAGLLPSYAADITKYLKDNPESAPQVAAYSVEGRLKVIIAAMSCDGGKSIIPAERDKLIASGMLPVRLKSLTTPDAFRNSLAAAPSIVEELYILAVEKGPAKCPP